jgi:rRNA maturation RNase YbeY
MIPSKFNATATGLCSNGSSGEESATHREARQCASQKAGTARSAQHDAYQALTRRPFELTNSPPISFDKIHALRRGFLDGQYADHDVAFTLITDTRMHALNFAYRQRGTTTDILTFRLADPPAASDVGGLPDMPGRFLPGAEILCGETGKRLQAPDGDGLLPKDLGDVFVNVEYCARYARSQRLPLEDYVPVVCAHGLAHLVGYTHDDESDYRAMQDAEREALKQLRRLPDTAGPRKLTPLQELDLQTYLP